MTFDFVAVPIFGKYIEPDKPTGFDDDPGLTVTLVSPVNDIPDPIVIAPPGFVIEGIPDNAPDIEPPKVIVPAPVIGPPVKVIPDTVPAVATDVTVPPPDAKFVPTPVPPADISR